MIITTRIVYGASRRTDVEELHARLLKDINERDILHQELHGMPNPVTAEVTHTTPGAMVQWFRFSVVLTCEDPTPEDWFELVRRAVQVQTVAGTHQPVTIGTGCES